jgi:hypothetical protein
MGYLLEWLLELGFDLAGWALWRVLLLPVFWVVSTPFILLTAVFQREAFRESVPEMYREVTEFWKDW